MPGPDVQKKIAKLEKSKASVALPHYDRLHKLLNADSTKTFPGRHLVSCARHPGEGCALECMALGE
eukprot:2402423-Alexandrium_andersonii.AAC.1